MRCGRQGGALCSTEQSKYRKCCTVYSTCTVLYSLQYIYSQVEKQVRIQKRSRVVLLRFPRRILKVLLHHLFEAARPEHVGNGLVIVALHVVRNLHSRLILRDVLYEPPKSTASYWYECTTRNCEPFEEAGFTLINCTHAHFN